MAQKIGTCKFLEYVHLNSRNVTVGLPKLPLVSSTCECCQLGKQHKEQFPKKSENHASQILEFIHTYLCGPLKLSSSRGSNYFITFTNDFSKKSWVYFLKYNNKTLTKFKYSKVEIKKQTSKNIIII
jgi:hypothetical protein